LVVMAVAVVVVRAVQVETLREQALAALVETELHRQLVALQ